MTHENEETPNVDKVHALLSEVRDELEGAMERVNTLTELANDVGRHEWGVKNWNEDAMRHLEELQGHLASLAKVSEQEFGK